MKRFILISISYCTLCFGSTLAQGLQAELDMARFDSPELGTYLDTYLKLIGNSLELENSDEGSKSRVHLTYMVTEHQDTVFYDSFILEGPVLDSDSIRKDFIDAQRIQLEKGNYNLKITLADVNSADGVVRTVEQAVVIKSATNKFKERMIGRYDPAGSHLAEKDPFFGSVINYCFSDVVLVEEIVKSTNPGVLTKSGVDLIPRLSNFYADNKDELTFYCEVYNTVQQAKLVLKGLSISNLFKDKSNAHKFLILTSIQDSESDKIIGNYASRQIVDSSAVIPILQTFDITDLESGNYKLVLELRDFKNDLIERKEVLFQRYNSITIPEDNYLSAQSSVEDKLELTFVGKYNRLEVLEEYLRCLHPISSQEEIQQVNRRMNFKDLNMMQEFLYYFWKVRDPIDPEGAWLEYWMEVEKVNADYTTNMNKGYDTDRGRVYLQYGAPNTISPSYFEPNTYPYEIWHYYVLKDPSNADQSNRKFIFANVDQGTKEFELIHSDAKNEITNARWHHDLHKRSSQSINLDIEESGDFYGGRSRDFFENPY